MKVKTIVVLIYTYKDWSHLVNFLPFCTTEITFVTFCSLACIPLLSPSENGFTLKENNLFQRGANSFLLE